MRRIIAILTGAIFLAGCGSDSPTSPGGGSNSQSVTGTVGVFSETRHPLTVPGSGELTLRLTWGDSSVDLDLYLLAANCTTSLYPLGSCEILAQSISPIATSETIRRTVSAGEQFQVWVDNLSTTSAMNYTLSIDVD